MPGALRNILLLMDIVAGIRSNQILQGIPTNRLLLAGVGAAVVRPVLFIAGGHENITY